MNFDVLCSCGKMHSVSAALAGSTLACSCGQTVPIPPLSKLRGAAGGHVSEPPSVTSLVESGEAEEYPSEGGTAAAQGCLAVAAFFLFGFAVLLGVPRAIEIGTLAGVGYSLMLIGQIWLFLLVARECPPAAVFFALVIPFFTWYFAMRRLDIAKWPLVLSFISWIVYLFGILQANMH